MHRIKFKRFGSSTFFGSFAPGDIAVVNEAVANHFVNHDMAVFQCAPEQPPQPAAIVAPAANEVASRPRKRKTSE